MFNAFRVIIRGRVQGVGFRYFTKARADELQIRGWVRNLPDGNVEVLACAKKEILERFMHYLETGPIGSQVDEAQFQWMQESQQFGSFEIRT